ncbi:hypothetical protein [Varunaivibrio sulfuroxidans]|uniref:Uncharacterized protein n=1 Tax=Varunaivibrio sulfuroxidans TaxID=1773489 RepID=A0A4R3JDK7_9PROT|nr:hypothetical protein [Varunaivibrio sulfuroxidans]TCS63505.1 hypothetical protein EDD55_103127 [Varunaivibrio sulfuroxidans]WES30350.1 hypothetical protein P3M64_12010 [Varunaivibrio sulfuroxidans]
MKKISTMIIFLALVLVGGAGAFLATWRIPAPTSHMVKTLPDARFPQ